MFAGSTTVTNNEITTIHMQKHMKKYDLHIGSFNILNTL